MFDRLSMLIPIVARAAMGSGMQTLRTGAFDDGAPPGAMVDS